MSQNAFTFAITAMTINLLISLFIGIYSMPDPETMYEQGTTDQELTKLVSGVQPILSQAPTETGVCLQGDSNCTSNIAGQGSMESGVQDAITFLLNIGGAISNAIKFLGLIAFGPITLSLILIPLIPGIIPQFVLGFGLVMWNLISLYFILNFILNRRGT